jgi:hypothetical protein
MFCPLCLNFFDKSVMIKCENCQMYFCQECYLDQVTDPYGCPELSYKPNPHANPKRIRRKLKANKKLKTDLCDCCHREFLISDLKMDNIVIFVILVTMKVVWTYERILY